MGRGPHITPNQREQIKFLRDQGLSFKKIADQMNISPNACKQAIKHLERTGSSINMPRLPRKRKSTPQMDRIIHRLSEANRFKTAVQIHKELKDRSGFDLSVRTVRRRLNEFGLMGHVSRKKPFVSLKNRKARLLFARRHLNWTSDQWRNVLFTDESKFNMFGSDGKVYIRRRPKEEFDPRCTKKTVKGNGGSVMVWAGFSRRGVGPIHHIPGIMDRYVFMDILNTVLLPYSEDHMPLNWTYQQDNDPKHTSILVKKWFRDNKINVLEWPSQSPDLNPIETLWNDVEKVIKEEKPTNKLQLIAVIKRAWQSIPVDRCERLIDSMPRRCAAVIKNFGYATGY